MKKRTNAHSYMCNIKQTHLKMHHVLFSPDIRDAKRTHLKLVETIRMCQL